jgi:hypothetical protein
MRREIAVAISTPGHPTAQVRQVSLPAGSRALSTLARIDYADAFTTRPGAGRARDRTGEQWARAVLEGASAPTRRQLRRGWQLLGLRLGSASDASRVLGWEIRRSTPDFVLLGATSRIGMPGELLFRRDHDGLLFCTFVQQRNPLARLLWARVTPAHQRIVRSLLARAAGREGG